MADTNLALDDGSLVDLLDRLLDTGVALDGNVLITLAGVDLIRLDLRLLLASVQVLAPLPGVGPDNRPRHRQHGLRHPDGRPRRAAPDRYLPPARTDCGPDRPPRARGSGGGGSAGRTGTPRRLGLVTGPDRNATDPDPLGAAGWPADPDRPADPGGGLAALVVAVVDIVRQLLERQALRRMDAGTLDADQVERLGRALEALERQVDELSGLLDARRSALSAGPAAGSPAAVTLPTHTPRGAHR